MATNTLIQYLERTAYDALPSGSTTAIGPQVMNRRQIETFIAGGAIAANELVAIDLSQTGLGVQAGTVVPADSTAGATVVAIGFALGSAAEGETVDVTIAGVHESAAIKSTATIAVGDRLKVSNSAGDADEYASGDTVPVIAYAMSTVTANVASVFVIKQF